MREQIGYLIVDRSETLQVMRGLEAAHHLLAHWGRLVRVFRVVVLPLVLAVFDVDPEIPVRRRVAPELVGDQYTWGAPLLHEQLAHQAPGSVPVAPALHQHIEHRAMQESASFRGLARAPATP